MPGYIPAAGDAQIRLALEILGAEGVSELRQKLNALNTESGELAAALGRDEISSAEFNNEMKLLATNAKNLEQALRSLDSVSDQAAAGQADLAHAAEMEAAAIEHELAMMGRLTTATGKASKGMAGFGQSALQSGRVVQDFAQGGIGGVLNNVEGLTQALGLGAGLAGIFTILGTAAFVAGPQIKAFFDSFKSAGPREFGDELDGLKRKVDELEKKELKLAVDRSELEDAKKKYDELKKAQAEFDAQQGRQNADEAESGKLTQERLDESEGGAAGASQAGKGKLFKDTLAMSERSGTIREARDAKAQAEKLLENAVDPGEVAVIKGMIRAAQERIDGARKSLESEAERNYGQILLRATKGRGADQAAAQGQLAGLTGLTFDSAKDVEQGEQDTKDAEQFGERAKAAGEIRRKKAAAARKAAADAKKAADAKTKADDDAFAIQAAKDAKEQDEQPALLAEAKANEAALDKETKKIHDTVGKQYQSQYEIATARNNAALANGDPSAVDPARLKAKLQNEMFAAMRKRGAGEQSARLATRGITGKGDEDLARRAADAANTNLNIAGQTLMIQRELVTHYQHMSQAQREQMAEVKQIQRELRTTQRTAARR